MTSPRRPPATPIIGVHLDLKGMNFRPSYIPHYLADLADQGINTLLVEYEDIFPFAGIDVAWDRPTAWTPATHRRFLTEAKRRGIELIPLQQCLGHLEYALSWPRYRHLAEQPESPDTIRLGDPGSLAFVQRMLEQIIAAHPDSRFVHLGMDEAHGLGPGARRLGTDPLPAFLAQLRPLVDQVAAAGKVAIIWSDMLERYYEPGAIDEFKGRLVVMPWFYHSRAEAENFPPLGTRHAISRDWLASPEDRNAPPIHLETSYAEDCSPALRRLNARYRRDRGYLPLAQVDFWTQLGADVLGAGALRFSANGPVMTNYLRQFENVRLWAEVIRKSRQLGVVGTSWARGTSWFSPNHPIDLQWPVVTELARAMGAQPRNFWPGLPPQTVDRIFRTLGRCHTDWKVEDAVADEMESLAPRLKAHHYEWRSTILMARTLGLHRRIDAALANFERYAVVRAVDTVFRGHAERFASLARDVTKLRRKVTAHFRLRYHGAALDEWVNHLFDRRHSRLLAARAEALKAAK